MARKSVDVSKAQQSEVHRTTADAEASPTSDDNAQSPGPAGEKVPWNSTPRAAEPLTTGTQVVSDDTDVGGPLIIKSDDPDLNPPAVPVDPFPTDRTPEIDPKVDD
jgi:hypothetical protein